MIKRLRAKFVAINMAIVTLLLCVILALVYYFTSANLENDSINMLRSAALNPPLPVPGEVMDADVNIPFFTVQVGPGGEIIDAFGGYYDLTDSTALSTIVRNALRSPGAIGVIDEYGLRYYRSDSPGRTVLVFADISSERATLSGLLRTCVIIGVIGFAAFFGISVAFSRWAVRPVERAWDEQRKFVAAASHELKTPLTVLLANAELMCAEGSTPCEQQALARGTLAAARRMRSLVEKLLELARADGGVLEPARTRLDWAQETNEALLPFEPLCFEKGLVLDTRLDAGIFVRGDAALLQQLAAILLDNACKYSSPGTVVRVVLKRRGKRRAVLSVANWGQPIPAKELANIFKRFYRMDAARSQSEGHGLGLSIAQQIVRRHGGKIWAESENGQNTFYAELPCTVK